MAGWRNREDRKPVCLSVRLRTDDGWMDATVRNLSSRGMMVQSLAPLQRNQFVEVSRGRVTVVARIVWSSESACGLRSQDRIDIDALLDRAKSGARRGGEERRERPRTVAAALPRPANDFEQRSTAARLIGKRAEALGLLAAAAFACVIVASSVFDALSAPFDDVRSVLQSGD